MVGGLNDPVGWDHLDNEAKTVKPVSGTAEIDVNDLTNTGKFEARLKIPEGEFVLAIDKIHEFNPCQNGGSSAFCTSMAAIQDAATTTGRHGSHLEVGARTGHIKPVDWETSRPGWPSLSFY